jgi:hypothetical protein
LRAALLNPARSRLKFKAEQTYSCLFLTQIGLSPFSSKISFNFAHYPFLNPNPYEI